jgi:myo-inositol 2-dehydrogenase/D-chiro-inositol 1-dehydrogenase
MNGNTSIEGPVTIGIIGTGRIGRIHATNLVRHVDSAEVRWVADPRIAQAQEWIDELSIPETSTDYHDILGDPTIDAVYVCSSTDTHARIVGEAADAGKHIFCEKPIDLDAGKVLAALARVEAAGVTMQVGFNRRFDHNFAALQAAVSGGDIGQVQLLKITSRDPEPPPLEYVKVSGGMFLDMTIHDFDMARFIAGSDVVEVSASGAVLVDPEIGLAGDVDTAVITLRFANGALGIIDNSRRAVYGYDQRVEVFGSEGMLRVENDTGNTVTLMGADGLRAGKPLWFFLERYADAFIAESRAFVASLQSGTPAPVSGVDGLKPILIGLAAQRSMKERRTVLIEEIETHTRD